MQLKRDLIEINRIKRGLRRNLIRFSGGVNKKKGVMFCQGKNRKKSIRQYVLEKQKKQTFWEREEKSQEQGKLLEES